MPDETDGWPSLHVREMCDLWEKRFGPGSAPGAKIAGSAKRLRKAGASWDRVMASWQRYLQVVDAEWSNPGTWASKWATWAPTDRHHMPETPRELAPDPSAVETWELISSALKDTLSTKSWETWMRPLRGQCFSGSVLLVAAPCAQHVEWVPLNYGQAIERAIRSCGLTCTVRVVP